MKDIKEVYNKYREIVTIFVSYNIYFVFQYILDNMKILCHNKSLENIRKVFYAMTRKHSLEFIKEQIEKEGYKLLSKEYVNNKTKLKIKCNKGHEYEVTYANFQQRHRCPICFGNKKHSYEYIKKEVEKVKGYKLLSKEYEEAHEKLKIKCDKGHEYEVTYANFQKGRRCAECSGNKKLTHKDVKEQIEKEGYKLLSKEYEEAHEKLKIKCNKGHEYEVRWSDFQQGQRCPICDAQKTSSKAENEIAEYIKSLNIKISKNNMTQIKNPESKRNLQLDIWIPKLKKAIEFNGEYWHAPKKVKERDEIKKQQCKKKGIDLLVIKEQDWNKDKALCFCDINDFLLSK